MHDMVKVTFYDASSGGFLGTHYTRWDSLPATFEAMDTMLRIRNDDWRVVRAIPPTSAEFRQTGALDLYLLPGPASGEVRAVAVPDAPETDVSLFGGRAAATIQLASGERISFSLATVCDVRPPLAPLAFGEQPTRCWHEDDWRQIEFVHKQDMEYIQQCFAEQSAFRRKHYDGTSFTSLYLRREHPTPLATLRIPVQSVAELAGRRALPAPLYMGPSSQTFRVVGASRVSVGGIGHVYYILEQGAATTIGIIKAELPGTLESSVDRLIAFGRQYPVALVDWNRLVGFACDDAAAWRLWAE